jgi:HlyD family secretion protein
MTDALRALQIGDEKRAPAEGRSRRSGAGRWLLAGSAGAAITAVAIGFAFWLRPSPVHVRVMTVSAERRASGVRLTAGGYVHHRRLVNVVARVSGVVSSLRVDEGDTVKEGDLLGTLDDRELSLQAAEARANLASVRAALAQLTAGTRPEEIAEARAKAEALGLTAERMDRELERARILADAGALSVQAAQTAETESRVSRKTYQAAQQALAAMQAGARPEALAAARAAVDAARARLDHALELLSRTKIRAPLSGRVLRKFLDVGSTVSFGLPYVEGYSTLAPGSPVVSIGELDGLEATADVNQTDLGRIPPGGAVDVRADAFPGRSHRAHVLRVSPRADRSKNTVEVTVRFDDPVPAELSQDMSVKLEFLSGPPPAAGPLEPQVPASAIVRRGDAPALFVVEKGRAHLRRVSLGAAVAGHVPVKEGLAEGDAVVVSPDEPLREGLRVVPESVPANGGEP